MTDKQLSEIIELTSAIRNNLVLSR
jgi:hypothetical protein